MASMVMPDAPVSGVKNARISVTTMAIPPGIQPTSAEKKRSSRRLDPPSANT